MQQSENINDLDPKAKIVGSKAWGKRIRREVQDLARKVDKGYMDLARLLYTVWDTPLDGDREAGPVYKSWGYTSFDDYVQGDLGIDPKRAQRLKRIWYRIEVELGSEIDQETKDRLLDLGFAKVRELIRVINGGNAKEWVGKAEELSHSKLCDLINQYLDKLQERLDAAEADGKPTSDIDAEIPEVEPMIPETFKLFKDQAKNVQQALRMAEGLSKSDVKSRNLDLICTNFLATNNLKHSDQDTENYLLSIESSMGVKLIAYDPKTGEIVYGYSTLETIARRDND